MAAPVVAASAAIVRQWFQQGYYPTLVPTPANVHNPSGERSGGREWTHVVTRAEDSAQGLFCLFRNLLHTSALTRV